MDEERDDYNREEWGIAHDKYSIKNPKANPEHECFDANAFADFMFDQQVKIARKHNKIEE